MTDGKELLDNPIAWGRALIEARDIDPIYDMLVGHFYQPDGSSDADFLLDQPALCRWLIAYWCFYHAGTASYISERHDFWPSMLTAARNDTIPPVGERWPRSPERRHFRGEKCIKAVQWLQYHFPDPTELIMDVGMTINGKIDAAKVIDRVTKLPQFGPWIAFKVADMLERVHGTNIEFTVDVAMYDSPRKGAEEAALLIAKGHSSVVVYGMLEAYKDLPPPGLPTRGCNFQEVETVLCKWHSARGGHYYIGKDINEISHGLKGWGALADSLALKLPGKGQT